MFGLDRTDLRHYCCTYNMKLPLHITYMKSPIADLYRWSWGRWRVSVTATAITNQIIEWLMMWLFNIGLEPYRAAPSRVSWQNCTSPSRPALTLKLIFSAGYRVNLGCMYVTIYSQSNKSAANNQESRVMQWYSVLSVEKEMIGSSKAR